MLVNITQLRRLVFRKWNADTNSWSVFTMEPDDLGQDTVMSFNIKPRKRTRASSMGSTETPIKGTFESLTASITFLLDNFEKLGKAIQAWNASTYAGAPTGAGNIVGDSSNFCADGEYLSVVAQGICDDGSTADIEFTRCVPSVDDDITIGTGDTPTQTLQLNPIIYNEALHAGDGYPDKTYRLGEYDTTAPYRLNATTGAYDAVDESES